MSVETYDMKKAVSKNRLVGLIRMMTGYQWHYAGSITSTMISALAGTATLLLIGYFVDDILFREDVGRLVPLVALGVLLLAAMQGIFSYLAGRLAAHTAESVAWRLRNYLFNHLQRLNFTYHDRMQTGELIQRVTSDVETVRRFFAEQGVGIGRIVLLFIVNLTAILFINWQLGLVSVVVVPVMLAVSVYFFRKISVTYEDFQEREAKLSTSLQENLSGVRVVKAFARQDYEINKFEADNWAKYTSGRRLILQEAYYWPSNDFLIGIQSVVGWLIGALMALDGQITVGQYIAYVGMLRSVLGPMSQMGRLIVQATTGLVSYDRVVEIINETREDLQEETAPPHPEIRGEVVFDDVSFQYEGGGGVLVHTPVLHNISFQVQPGQTIAILGSTGAGKTSLMALLPRFYDYTSGSIRLDGMELREYPRSFLRENIGVVEQEPFLFSRSIRENITYSVGRVVPDEEVYAAARAAAVHDVIISFPEGYETMVGERGVTLSGGQKQRIALARTLLKNPRILILDDATSSVDTETEASIRSALNKLMQNRTSFVIAHRITTVMHADLILVMDKGRIVQMGTHETLVDAPGIYQRTYDLQSRIETELQEELARV